MMDVEALICGRVAPAALLAACGGGGARRPHRAAAGTEFPGPAGGNNVPTGTAPTSGCTARLPTPAPGAAPPQRHQRAMWSISGPSMRPAPRPWSTRSWFPGIGTVSDVQVSDDGTCWSSARSAGRTRGLYVYDLTDPRHPAFLDSALVEHRTPYGDVADIDGHRYVFAARNPAESRAHHLRHYRRPPPSRSSLPCRFRRRTASTTPTCATGWPSCSRGTPASSSTTSATAFAGGSPAQPVEVEPAADRRRRRPRRRRRCTTAGGFTTR